MSNQSSAATVLRPCPWFESHHDSLRQTPTLVPCNPVCCCVECRVLSRKQALCTLDALELGDFSDATRGMPPLLSWGAINTARVRS